MHDMARGRSMNVFAGLLLAVVLASASACSADDKDGSGAAPAAGGTAEGGKPAKSPAAPVASVGQPFELLVVEGGPAAFRVTVAEVRLAAEIDPFMMARFSGTVPPLPPGQQWVVVRFELTNTGLERASWTPQYVTLDVGAKKFAMNDAESSVANVYNSALNADGLPTSAFDGLNPGLTGTTYGVWQIPADAKPTTLTVPRSSGLVIRDDTPSVAITVP